jgi:hypothetical protein
MQKTIGTIITVLVLFFLAKMFIFKGGEEVSPGKIFTVEDLRNNARDYDEKIVAVQGTVVHSGSLGLGGYTVEDGTGKIMVLTTHAVPNKEQKVKVKGKVVQAAKIGGNTQMALNEVELTQLD